MAKIQDTHKAFITKLQVLYDVEQELEKALPELEEAAVDPELKESFRDHLEETKNHRERIEEAFSLLEVEPSKMKSEGIRGIIADGQWCINLDAPDNLKDAMLASAARYAEHYEMAGYMSAILESRALGLEEVTALLMETLDEEEAADQKLEVAIEENLEKM